LEEWCFVFFRERNRRRPDQSNVPINLKSRDNILARDYQYAKFLEHHVNHQKRLDFAQLLFKYIFFFIVCGVFVAVVIIGALSIYRISQKENIAWTDFGTALTGLGSVLGVLIILPSKIAEHLFPAAADKNAMEFIKSMQDYDLSIKQCPDDHEDIDVEKPEDPEQNDSPNE
jgi:hypothetical protein